MSFNLLLQSISFVYTIFDVMSHIDGSDEKSKRKMLERRRRRDKISQSIRNWTNMTFEILMVFNIFFFCILFFVLARCCCCWNIKKKVFEVLFLQISGDFERKKCFLFWNAVKTFPLFCCYNLQIWDPQMSLDGLKNFCLSINTQMTFSTNGNENFNFIITSIWCAV